MLTDLEPRLIHAPELYGSYWLNSEPISIREQLGNIFVIDFWDYTCVNCIRTLPYIKHWAEKYKEYGVITVGVHTPEFRFGQQRELIEDALQRFGIDYPVMMDNDAIVWSAFANRYWPTRLLLDKNGYIRFTQHGEGRYEAFERALQQLLFESGYHSTLPELVSPIRKEDAQGVVCYRPSNELFGGFLRSSLGNQEGMVPESTMEYSDPNYYIAERFYAHGLWRSTRESFCYDDEERRDGWLILRYEAVTMNAVLGTTDGSTATIRVEQDGRPLSKSEAGDDIEILSTGESVVRVGLPRMFEIVKNQEFGEHVIRLITSNNGLELFSFGFTACAIPDFISPN